MRILFAADVLPNPDSGAAGTEYRTIHALREAGHDVDAIWAGDLPHRVRHGNLHYALELPRAYRSALRAALARNRYDVLHVNQPHAYLAAMDHGRRGSTAFVNRSHGWEARAWQALAPWRRRYGVREWRFPRAPLGRALRRLIARQCRLVCDHSDGIIVSSTLCREFVVREYGVAPERVRCIAQAPPASYAETDPLPMTAERARRVLLVGLAGFVKGPNVAAEAMGLVCSRDGTPSFTWVCPARDHASVRALLPPVARERVELVAWRGQGYLLRIYDEHGLFLFASLFEGFGKAFIEAMQRGLCVVASDEGGMHDIVTDGRDGFLVGVGDAVGFAERLVGLAGDVERCQAVSAAAVRTAGAHSWRRVASETAAFYEELLDRRRAT